MSRPSVLFLGGSRWQADFIGRAASLGVRALVADISGDAPGRAKADRFVQMDTSDREALLALARREGVRAVIAEQSDRVVPVAGFLNEQLGLPGIDLATAHRFTDKLAQRRALEGSGIAMPRYAEVRSVAAAAEHAARWGYPVVIKPKSAQASLGVFKIADAAMLALRFPDALAHAADGALLVEEFVDGLEVTVEAFSIDGRCHVLAVSEKAHYADNPCVACRLAYPPRLAAAVHERLRADAARAVEALGLRQGISHAEYRLRDGVPHLVEAAARGGGNRIASVIVPHVSGVDVYALLMDAVLGRPVSMPRIAARAAVLEFFDFPAGQVMEIEGVEAARREARPYELSLDVASGQSIRAAADDRTRPGFFIVLADERDDADARSARIRDLVRPRYAPRCAA
jgi:biotin carboxylase